MSKYIFHEGKLADTYNPLFERFLFSQERHLYCQSTVGWSTFSWIDETVKKNAAQIHFNINGSVALSPCKAPFGSVEFSEVLTPESLFQFLSESEKKLREKGIERVVIVDTPQIYRPQQSAILTVLLSDMGFEISNNEICSSIIIDEEPWKNKISKDELYHLKRCQREQLSFRSIGMEKLRDVYNFIDACRHERGTTLSMTLDQLQSTILKCPNDFLLFGVFQQNEMIAASIVVRVNDRILYDFYYGHSRVSNHLSPVVFLLDGQYNFCKKNGYQLLDLGTSSLDNKTNFSLLNFKRQVGGVLSMKLTFQKTL